MKKWKAAVIGCGSISPMHLDALEALENIELAGVCDIRRERAEERAQQYHTRAYTDYKELFEAEKPDAEFHDISPYRVYSRTGIELIDEANGEVESVDTWGKRRLAYEIDDKNEGYYVLINFKSDIDFPAELDRVYKITEGVMRTIIIKK